MQTNTISDLFVTRSDPDQSLPRVRTGSQSDSQPLGGRYDDTYGVVSGLEVSRSLGDAGVVSKRDITLVNWTDEEGARFVPSRMGSSGFEGALPHGPTLGQRDRKDALAATAYLTTGVGRIAKATGEQFRGTVGELWITPNSAISFSDTPCCRLTFVTPDDAASNNTEQALATAIVTIAVSFNSPATIGTVLQVPAKPVAPRVMADTASAA